MTPAHKIDHSTAATLNQPNDLEGFKRHVNGHRTGMPDLQFSIQDIVIEGERLAFRWEMARTNTGSYMGRPPSGRPR